MVWLSRAADYGDDVEGDDPMLARSELLLAYVFQDGQEGDSSYSDYMLYGRNDRSVRAGGSVLVPQSGQPWQHPGPRSPPLLVQYRAVLIIV